MNAIAIQEQKVVCNICAKEVDKSKSKYWPVVYEYVCLKCEKQYPSYFQQLWEEVAR